MNNRYSFTMKAGMAAICAIVAQGCTMPGGAPYTPSASSPGYAYDSQSEVAGNWCFQDGSQTNRIVDHGDTLTITPSRGRAATYQKLGPGLYKDMDGSGTYQFESPYRAVWRANDRGGRVIAFVRC